ncbi:MAG: hypothetical protein ABIQ44_09550 [Chloroflexia bacterium]
MFGKLVRLLVRLFFFALIAGVVGFVITRLMGGEDDDFEDFEDLESSFEFNETPVEIDVSGPATSDASTDSSSGSDSAPEYRVEAYANNATVALDENAADSGDNASDETADGASDENSTEAVAAGTEGPRLIDIKGIGPSYEARLRGIGIISMSDLLEADSEQVAEQVSVIGGAAEVDDWKQQAKAMTSGENS